MPLYYDYIHVGMWKLKRFETESIDTLADAHYSYIVANVSQSTQVLNSKLHGKTSFKVELNLICFCKKTGQQSSIKMSTQAARLDVYL